MNIKRRLFKEFGQLDNNRYYYANIHGEFYYGVATVFAYKERSVWGDKDMVEEESFVTTKIPEAVMVYLERFVQFVETKGEEDEFNFAEVRQDIEEKMMNVALAGEPTPQAMVFAQKISDSFHYSWNNDSINAYLEGTKGWVHIYFEYNGLASRTVWLARSSEDTIDIICLKLFGMEGDNEVVSLKRILLTSDLAEKFLDKISSELPKKADGLKENEQ
jgi:hypothetical protein